MQVFTAVSLNYSDFNFKLLHLGQSIYYLDKGGMEDR